MKNLKGFPFERNRYFYGKLLSVEDFETEQKYFNDKRRAINRFLFGSGVVCGLGVVEVDDESISVERGFALDFAGREIALDEPAVRRITELEGYDDELDTDFYYLCLEYREEAAELMHNVAGTAGRNNSEYNKYKESYRIFVTQEEPSEEIVSPARLYEDRQTVFHEHGVWICQVLPKFLEMGEDVPLRIEIEHTGKQEFSFAYDLDLSFLTNGEGNRVHVAFQKKDTDESRKYQIEIPLKAACVSGVQAEASLVKDSFELQMEGREYKEAKPCTSQAFISSQDSYEAIQEEYYRTAMDYIAENDFQKGIYLAKIYIVRAGGICLIERIESLPFDQKIMHTEVSTAMISRLVEDVTKLKKEQMQETEDQKEKKEKKPVKTAYGRAVFEVDHARPGDILYSDEIVHGLGFGPVNLTLGYEVDQETAVDARILFGDTALFQDRHGFRASLGARLSPSEGTFEIAMKVLENSGAKQVYVYWSALCDQGYRAEPTKKKRIVIQPDNPNVTAEEGIVFTALLEGFTDERLKWEVKDRDGGTISKKGKYTAPAAAGIYQITVSSTAYPKVQASTFVMVREKE